MKHQLFAYGTLQLPEKLKQLIGRELPFQPAQLTDFRCGLVERANFPGIVPAPGEQVQGQLLSNILQQDLLKLDEYEGELYRRQRVEVESNGAQMCWVYVIAPWAHQRVTDTPWTIEWYRTHGSKGRLTYRY